MFIIGWGWGQKKENWDIKYVGSIVATWDYFHFCSFPIAYNIKWYFIDEEKSGYIVSYEKIKEALPENTPDISLWNRYGLLFFIVGWIIFGVSLYLYSLSKP